MITRRLFSRAAPLAAAARIWSEPALAQRALVSGEPPAGTVWLNANENPEGPGDAAIEAMTRSLAGAGRYHFQEFREFYAAIARSVGLESSQVLVGAGSSEVICAAVHAFTGAGRPLVYSDPTFELPVHLARALGRQTVPVGLEPAAWSAAVKPMAAEVNKSGGGLVYLCNPNNPTSSITPQPDVDWLVANLPPDGYLLVDEAYLDFSGDPRLTSALAHVKAGRNVIVTRTFSKIYGMAGLRVGFACARPELIGRMQPFLAGVISWVSTRAVLAALGDAALVPGRKARYAKIRADLCAWLKAHEFRFIEPHANFVMIETGRNVREVIPEMIARGVAPGRPFPPLDRMLRVTVGSEADMARFKQVFLEVMRG